MSLSKIALCIILLWANSCLAELCSTETIENLARHIGYQPAQMPVSGCKIMPNKPQYMLVAIARISVEAAAEEGPFMGDYDLDIIMMDTASYKPVKRFTRAKAIPSDAVALTDLTIDTAKYNLNNRQRAFGLRISFSANSRVNPFAHTLLNLYVENDDRLQEVLQDFEVASSAGEWDGNCAGEFSSSTSTLAVKKPEAAGFSDLLVRTQNYSSVARLNKEECIEEEKPMEIEHSLLKYTGGRYQLAGAKAP